MESDEISLFTDGACSGNPGPGGWAYILRDPRTGEERRDSGADPSTTNNRMEMLSVIRGLESLEGSQRVRLVTDSQYVVKGITEWMAGWKKRGWKRKEKNQLKPVMNLELWQRIDELVNRHRVTCEWIRGHAGHAENEECDRLAVAAYQQLMATGRGSSATPNSLSESATVRANPSSRSTGNSNPVATSAKDRAKHGGDLFSDSHLAQEFQPSQRSARAREAPISYMMRQGLANPDLISLAAGIVDTPSLPAAATRSACEQLFADSNAALDALQYGTTDGELRLREALVQHLASLEGQSPAALALSPERMILGTGSQQLLYLLGEVLADPHDIVLAGVPAYFVYLGSLQSLGIEVVPIATDADGLIPASLDETLGQLQREGKLDRVAYLYDVPWFNNPSGITLAAERRPQILEILQRWSRKRRIYLVEDAAYRELRFDGPDIPSLYSQDEEHETVLYAGTFSKSFSPGLKTGYLVAPPAIIDAMVTQKGHHDFGSSNFTHQILTRILEAGEYAPQVARLRDVYRNKRDAMLAALDRETEGLSQVTYQRPQGGLYVWMRLPTAIRTSIGQPFFEACLREGVLYIPGEFCYPPGTSRSYCHLRLSYGVQTPAQIDEGIRRLARVLRKFL